MLELMIALGIIAIISMLGMTALESSTLAMSSSQSKEEVQSNIRDAISAMTRELQLASKATDDSLSPPLEQVTINLNPAPNSPVEIVFQTPTDGTGFRWSQPIRFRYVNEDSNGNGRLDNGEDADGDGALTRRIVRIQDRNGNGTTTDPGEETPVAGANDLTNAQFARNGDVVTITLTSQKFLGMRRSNPVSATVSHDVYLQN